MVDQDSKASCREHEHLCAERVVFRVVRGPKLPKDECERGVGAEDEDHLHEGVVVRDKVGEEIEVARCEDDGVQHLALSADPCNEGRTHVDTWSKGRCRQ